ncbi:hypothetical protein [Actinokineospora globicatena]|uniref:Uncharacterized protein n=1 Tax=Actinokineospora globicatena TaxID=103729 RepID=A0A9W6QLG5_9PSEU|nr:hypothetical protein [Actinokineospora globicatena]GLW91800.1 hypothetical protein Aglo03_26160 [Actinokineospora globicatena]
MTNNDSHLDRVRVDSTEDGVTVRAHVEDGILHVTVINERNHWHAVTERHYRLVQIEQQWVEVTE